MKVYAKFISKVGLFKFSQEPFIQEICMAMYPKVCLEGDYIIQEFEMAEHFNLISSGRVHVLNGDKEILNKLSEGDFFGEVGLLIKGNRTANVVARSVVSFYQVPR